MKKSVFVLFASFALALASCDFKSFDDIIDPPVDPTKFNYSQIDYEMQPGHSKSELQGAPWINSNIFGMVEKIKQPSLKDDFYVSANYDDFIEGNPGTFDNSANATNNYLNGIYNGTIDYSNRNYLQQVRNIIGNGDTSALMEYIDNLNIYTLMSSKEVFLGACPLFDFYKLDGSDTYNLYFNDGYSTGVTGYQTFALYGLYYPEYRTYGVSVMEQLYSALGYDEQVANYYAEYGMQSIQDMIYYVWDESFTGSTVSDIEIPDLKSALVDAGLNLSDKINIDYDTYSHIKYVYSMLDNQPAYLLYGIRSILLFEHRHLVGIENYKDVSRILNATGIFYDEVDITNYSYSQAVNQLTTAMLPRLIDKAFISVCSSEETVEIVDDLIIDIVNEYKEMVRDADWLSETAKDKVVTKLDYMGHTSCHSQKIETYQSIDETGLYSKSILDLFNDYQEMILNQKVIDNYEYNTTLTSFAHPYTVNAFYSPTTNEFVILDGLLPGGFIGDSVEVTYARVGMVIGHEISHAFDSQGSYFDEYGQYHDQGCWPSEDMTAFRGKVNKLIKFYNEIKLNNNKKVSGKQIDGEATADMGGLHVMLRLASKIENFDYDLFFKSYASLWKEEYDSYTMQAMYQDSHPFAYLRVNVTVAQFEEFYQTYNIKAGDRMFIPKSERVAIW